jgi:cation diffusion facilitator family transporter
MTMRRPVRHPLPNSTSTRLIVRVTLVGAIANILLAGMKISVGVLTGSQALLADGVHTFSDLGTDVAILLGAPYWNAPADATHPYGHRRLETLVSLFIAGSLAVIGLGIGWKALVTMTEPHNRPPGAWALAAALVSIGVKETLYHWTAAWGRRIRSSALVANAWHRRSDALSSVPVAIAVIAGWIFPDLTYVDHIAALFVTIMLLKATWTIARPSISELMETPTVGLDKWLIEEGRDFPFIHEIHRVRSRRLGGAIFVDMHMLVDPDATVEQAHDVSEAYREHLKELNEDLLDVLIHIEPFTSAESEATDGENGPSEN